FVGAGLCMISPYIWYCSTASCTGEVTVSLAGSSFDTMLAVYNGCECYPTTADMLGCNDDANLSYQSEVNFAAIAGNQYLIEIGGYGSETGQGVLNISCEGESASKDDCINARAVGDVTNVPFDTTNTTFDGRGLCLTSPNIWYRYTASCTGEVTVSLLGSSFDTMLAAYEGTNCYPASGDMVGCNDDFDFTYQSQVMFAAVAGEQYLIEIGGYGSETGQGVLSIRCEGMASADKPDLGDAPDSTNNFGNSMTAYPKGAFTGPRGRFPTVFNDGSGVGPYGPVHLNDRAVAFLGKAITGETEADTGPDEDGVNNLRSWVNSPDHDRGDDAVDLPLTLPDCGWAAIDYEVTVVEPGTDLWVNVWLDFNRDGDWDDTVNCPAGSAKEWAVQNQFLFGLPARLNQITTPAFLSSHPTGTPRQIWMRITLSEQPWTGGSNPGQPGNAGSGPLGKYQIGETEDYYFIPETTGQTECPLCEDVNGDGTINIEDLAAYVNLWLANCL
ncbi:MAG: GEVED domain-containing protein, partial [Planctomycetota bacterium]|nr:GEVED domain-containing protein [Planctomycetota bacterium]